MFGRRRARRWSAAVTATALTFALIGCGSDADEGGSPDSDGAPSTEVTDTTATPTPSDTTPVDTAPTDTAEPAPVPTSPTDPDDPNIVFPSLDPPTGEPMVVGLVNTEGTPGLNNPEIREAIQGAVEYLNQHGGIGDRPVELETCIANGSPETSQACAQELTGKGVELVLLGLDLFPHYATYAAASVPVIGMLPILPGDYTADALFLTGGSATVMAAAANVAQNHFGAQTVGIVSADNAGANSTLAALTASLDKAGINWTAVKGGDNETDAGYQGLMREAMSTNPDLLVSLYADSGCVGTIRGRAALGIETPVLTTGVCSSTDVLDEVGDDAVGWTFLGVQTRDESPAAMIMKEIMGPVLGIDPDEVDPAALGLGGVGVIMALSIAVYGNQVAAAGMDVTGAAISEWLVTEDGLKTWPGVTDIECGASAAYPSICAFSFPVAEYHAGGDVLTVPGLEAVSAIDYLP